MSWSERHHESDAIVAEAEAAVRRGDLPRARSLYVHAAAAEQAEFKEMLDAMLRSGDDR